MKKRDSAQARSFNKIWELDENIEYQKDELKHIDTGMILIDTGSTLSDSWWWLRNIWRFLGVLWYGTHQESGTFPAFQVCI